MWASGVELGTGGTMARQNKFTIQVAASADTHTDRIGQAHEVLVRLARLIGRQMAREAFARDLRGTRAEKDDGRPDENDGGANDVPAIGPRSLEEPEPSDRGRYVDTAVGSIGTTSIVRVD